MGSLSGMGILPSFFSDLHSHALLYILIGSGNQCVAIYNHHKSQNVNKKGLCDYVIFYEKTEAFQLEIFYLSLLSLHPKYRQEHFD